MVIHSPHVSAANTLCWYHRALRLEGCMRRLPFCTLHLGENRTVFASQENLKGFLIIMASMRSGKEERIRYVKGDLFTSPGTDSLAHCISEDCHMSAGIAAVFKKKFGGVQELLNQRKTAGEVAVLKRENRYVYYLITKSKYFHKPTYDNLRSSLEAMKIHCLKNGVTCISMPKIGCGLDRLDWSKVSVMLEEVFEDTDVKITVYTL